MSALGAFARAYPWMVVVAGVGALAARPPASVGALAVTVAVGLSGAWVLHLPHEASERRSRGQRLIIVLVGWGIFALGRWLHPGAPSTPVTVYALSATIASAAAEEVFFRHFVYRWLAQWGSVVAIAGAAVLFALVHVPAYGIGALPIDFAAGVLFGWQRWASGGATAPVLTHAFANVLQFLP